MSRLRLVYSRKNSDPSPTLLQVRYKMLPIVTLEDWRLRRLRTQLLYLQSARPHAFTVVEKLVSNLTDAAGELTKSG